VPYMVFIFAVVLLVVIAQNPHEVSLIMCVIYAMSGPAVSLYKKGSRKTSLIEVEEAKPDLPTSTSGKQQPGE